MHFPGNRQSERTLRTRVVHAGERAEAGEHPLVEPIHQNSAYAFEDSAQADRVYADGGPLYARDGMPNVRTLERAVARLEGAGDAVAASSGMAAIAITCLALLKSGDHVLIGDDGYCDTAALLNDMGSKFNLRITRTNLNNLDAVRSSITPATKLVFAETISNPGMRLVDLDALSAITRERGALLVVDNTLATPVLCRPIEFGADLVIHSAGKFLGGHSDVTAGIVAGSSPLVARLKRAAYLYGPLLAPMEAWLTLRGLKTLAPRMTWASQSAATIADWLGTHPAVAEVNYAGRHDHEQSALARRLLPCGAGSVLSFCLAGGEPTADAVIAHLRTIPYVPSIGGLVTIASYPPRSPIFDDGGDQILTPYRSSTIRLSIGLEEAADIIAELGEALTAALRDVAPETKD
jgi:cystathionine beta-lyase/cystathionine gamma-synthase